MWYRVIGNGNTLVQRPQPVSVIIDKVNPSFTPPAAVPVLAFSGSPHKPITPGSALGGTMQYMTGRWSGNTEAFSMAIP